MPDDDPEPSDAEVAQLLETVNQVLAEPLTRDDVVGAYAGLRPLVLPGIGRNRARASATADLSRKHLLSWDGPVLTVVGGKLTTYRAMAEEAVDAVVARLGRGARADDDRPAAAGRGRSAAGARRGSRRRPGWSARYGTEAAGRRMRLGSETVVEGRPETVGELRFAVRHEGARTVERPARPAHAHRAGARPTGRALSRSPRRCWPTSRGSAGR